jgi:cobalt-zinc-cadmium efflux system outer membrane protein
VRVSSRTASCSLATCAVHSEIARVAERIREITEARLREGDISDLESRATRNDAAQAAALLQTLTHDRDASRVALLALIGVDDLPASAAIVARADAGAVACAGDAAGLIELALASRPDVRAAEIAIEAAGQLARWERSRVVNLIAALDANGQGREGYEVGPGIGLDLPVFFRNQGAIGRAASEIERASHAYTAVRLKVSSEVRTALVRLTQAQEAERVWTREILPSLETEQRQAESAYRVGELPLISLLDVTRRLGDARLRAVDASASLGRAAVTLDQSVGRICVGS